ncbi:GAF domain-containing protein [Saccharopolyspora erythraea]|uniref:GAF domain-containing protein n=1 Tax=Saccharopolyspora erythraea TaxID=1836 RepID=UPI001BA5372B|nr:GAF domain-containing protein [Saccharopolyspora erythraea]QUH03000.1 GAF domain-containing protein [Saccharopolyspora erythraea]
MDTEPDLADRRRFARHFGERDSGTARWPQVADTREQLWSPLARQFADLGRDLFAVGSVAGVLQLVVDVAAVTVPGAAMAGLTVREAGGNLSTAAQTDAKVGELDALQQESAEGPVADATRADGTGLSYSTDVAVEPSWDRFGEQAARHGVRSVLAAGVFLATGTDRHAALTVCSTEPRGLAAADPDVVLVLAAHGAVALDAVGEQDPEHAAIGEPLRSSDVITRAADVLIGKRGLEPEDAYDVLWRASLSLAESWRE